MSIETDVVEGNKLIGTFDGWTFLPNGNVTHPNHSDHGQLIELKADVLQYHSSWDWLMQAVKKWNDIVISKRNGVSEGWTKWQYKTVMLRTDIKPVFKDLVEAIQWYNNQSK